jgi:hypothetical protein
MASFDTLLMSVRSETPTSFFLVLSKTAFFANCAFCCPPAAASFLRPARFETAYTQLLSAYAEANWVFALGFSIPWLVPNCDLKRCPESVDGGVVCAAESEYAAAGKDEGDGEGADWGVCEERCARMFAAVLDRRAAFLDLQRPPAHDDGRPGRN